MLSACKSKAFDSLKELPSCVQLLPLSVLYHKVPEAFTPVIASPKSLPSASLTFVLLIRAVTNVPIAPLGEPEPSSILVSVKVVSLRTGLSFAAITVTVAAVDKVVVWEPPLSRMLVRVTTRLLVSGLSLLLRYVKPFTSVWADSKLIPLFLLMVTVAVPPLRLTVAVMPLVAVVIELVSVSASSLPSIPRISLLPLLKLLTVSVI